MRCPRCGGGTIAIHDERFCLADGTVQFPARATDAVEVPGPQRQVAIAKNAGRPWSVKDREYVLANKDRLSAAEMGRHLGRTERSVHHLLSKLAIRKRRAQNSGPLQKNPPDLTAEIEDQVRVGALPSLARRYGLTYSAAYSRLYRRGIRLRQADGLLSIADVMRLYGCSKRRVLRLLQAGVLEPLGTGQGVRLEPSAVEAASRFLRAKSRHDPRRRRPHAR